MNDNLSNEYDNDLSRLNDYFIRHSGKFNNQMNCSTFLECICRDLKLNKIDIRLELNDIFYRIQSSLVAQGVYIVASLTIDFHGFILCLQHLAQTFHFNLRMLIKNLINTKINHKYTYVAVVDRPTRLRGDR